MEKHILIPTDFSNNAWNALSYAVNLYKETPCTFYLLNAFQLFHFSTDSVIEAQPGEKAYEEASRKSREGLEKTKYDIEQKVNNQEFKFELITTYSPVKEAVKQVLEKKEIDLIIMGTKGENNPVNTIYGSNAVNVMERIHSCPVLVIPENSTPTDTQPKEIVFATNYKFYYKRRELAPLIDIAGRLNAAIRILYIANEDDLTQEQINNKAVLEDYLSDLVHTFHTLTQIKVAAGIHSFIESRDSSLLVIFNRKHGVLSSLFSKSLIQEIGYKPDVPVLVLRGILK